MTTWRKEFEDIGICADELEFYPKDLNLDREFDNGFGCSEGRPFTAWSKDKVYFPVNYDGSEWIGWVPRNPCEIATSHVGGQ